MTLDERIERYLAATPGAIAGKRGHDQTFKTTCALVNGFALAEEQALHWLRVFNAKCDPPWSETELAHKVAGAFAVDHAKPRGHLLGNGNGQESTCHNASVPTPPQEPQFKLGDLHKFIAGLDVNADLLAARSPICPSNRTPASALHSLYQPGEKVLIFDDFQSQGEELWTHPGLPYDASALSHFAKGRRVGVWFLCNPVDGECHINDVGQRSWRSHQNVTSWRYLLVESDREDIAPTQWLAALAKIPLPIAAIYETGGRLAHALIRVDAPTQKRWDEIKENLRPVLILIGADPRSLSAVRLTRLPQCERLGSEDEHGGYSKFKDGPHLQRLLYLNPHPDGTPITEQPALP